VLRVCRLEVSPFPLPRLTSRRATALGAGVVNSLEPIRAGPWFIRKNLDFFNRKNPRVWISNARLGDD
jgi:hypothetical protein